jgi:hypothetical protein
MQWPFIGRELLTRERELSELRVSLLQLNLEHTREQLQAERGEVRRLTDVIIKMRRRSFEAVEPKKPIQPPDTDGEAVQRAEHAGIKKHARRQFISKAVAELVLKGVDPMVAEEEAARLWEQATDMHPAGG